ncbi:hypothetical protein EHS25_009761 [Saitozyma podzolica]|jgi:hypothetical protein|uniref:Protein PBN1 n=1 Tax=Saitozyma podzolica TaxID=1890683 RepID=A0A427YK40_9TREE|nr:hypothetical protein EHS25_009761 [Saitozyma podzolica]
MHPLNLTVLPPARSLHPALLLVPSSPPLEGCKAHAHAHAHIEVSLPDALFPDRNELLDKWSLPGGPIAWTLTPEVIDIERPVDLNGSSSGGSVLRLELDRSVEVEVPLHARYLPPNDSGEMEVVIDHFRGDWFCGEATQELSRIQVEPVRFLLPTGRPAHQLPVEIGTAVAMWLGCVYLAWRVLALSRRRVIRTQIKTKP